ncbi:hypothetical protein EJ04DRAFT_79791 [Polyplosphaeria fusca]|uniref:Uncharacterized protein n=1 Tax=Polyplosphaeria fusca TaxID=682080 RepID=A0A9P4R6N2_9PLEO|nr:hypothetical protein EJ04DRAFT_79791 [Polyplosphaeria fusca]
MACFANTTCTICTIEAIVLHSAAAPWSPVPVNPAFVQSAMVVVRHCKSAAAVHRGTGSFIIAFLQNAPRVRNIPTGSHMEDLDRRPDLRCGFPLWAVECKGTTPTTMMSLLSRSRARQRQPMSTTKSNRDDAPSPARAMTRGHAAASSCSIQGNSIVCSVTTMNADRP